MTGKNNYVLFAAESAEAGDTGKDLLLVAEGLHVLNQRVYRAVTDRDANQLVALARNHLPGVADALAVNLGSGRTMARITPWVAETLLEAIDVPLFFSANILAHPGFLQSFGSRIVINAVTAAPELLPGALQAAKEYGCSVVVLLVSPGVTPAGVDDRLQLAAGIIDLAAGMNLPLDRLYIDPVLSCRPDPAAMAISRGIPDVGAVAETISLIKELDGSVKTLVGLGTSIYSQAGARRAWYRQHIVSLLAEAGLDAIIMNCQPGSLNIDPGRDHGLVPLKNLSRNVW